MAEPIVLGIVGIKNMGEYNSQTDYEKLNVVTYQGSTYCALQDCKGKLPTNTDYWQLYAEKGDKGDTGDEGPKPVKGVDYYTNEDKEDILIDLSDEISSALSGLTSATPVVVSSMVEMTDTSKIYVLSTDGHWYWYNVSEWVAGGVYQATELPDNSITSNKYKEIEILSKNHFDKQTISYGYIDSEGVVHTNGTSASGLNIYSDYIELSGSSVAVSPFHNIIFYTNNKAFISGTSGVGVTVHSIPATAKYCRISAKSSQLDTIIVNLNDSLLAYDDYKFAIKYLGFKKYTQSTSFSNPIIDNEINFSEMLDAKINDTYIVIDNDSVTNKPYLSINKNLLNTQTTRATYVFQTNKKVCELIINCKTIGENRGVLGCRFYNKSGTEIYASSIGNNYLYTLNNTDWKTYKFRFLIPQEAYFVRILIGAYADSGMYVRDANIKMLDRAELNANNNILKYCGHQGMNYLAPKNTIPCFEYAVASGVNECVINVNWTSDNELVCLHDDTIDATSDGTGNIHDMTYATALTYDFGSWFSSFYTGTKIPKFEDVLLLFAKAGIIPVIRWNNSASDTIRDKIFDALEKNNLKGKAIIIGFDINILGNLKALHPEYQYGFSGYGDHSPLNQLRCELIIEKLGTNAIVDYSSVPSTSIVNLAHANGLIIGCWFVNTVAALTQAINNGADYIKTDLYPLQNCDF